jgi:hypothetical protein
MKNSRIFLLRRVGSQVKWVLFTDAERRHFSATDPRLTIQTGVCSQEPPMSAPSLASATRLPSTGPTRTCVKRRYLRENLMRTFVCCAILTCIPAASTVLAGPLLTAAAPDNSAGAPALADLASGEQGVELEFGNIIEEATDAAPVFDDSVGIDPAELVPPPPPVAPIELIGAPAPVNPPDFIGTVEFGGASGGGSGAPAGVSVVPVPLAAYGGLALMLLPVGRGVWRRARHTSGES